MKRQRSGDDLERVIRKARADEQPKSAEWHEWARDVEANEMEEDARRAIGGDEHPTAALNLWRDEHWHVHDSDQEEEKDAVG